ncbi:MAG: hypothetical protein M3361_18590, partial [Candidatus Tectomicrobia bacterium]|nr:hypothetical protein [Candidatus Tectomicrobia bacterium]
MKPTGRLRACKRYNCAPRVDSVCSGSHEVGPQHRPEEEPPTTSAEVPQRVMAQLSPEKDRAEIPALLYTLADIALHRVAQEATAAMLTGSGTDRRDCADVEATLTTLEASWG